MQMSCLSGIVAEELCLLAHEGYDAGQRALWHLDAVGRLIDCSVRSIDDLELLYGVPGRTSQPLNAPKFPHSQSSEEFGFFGDALSPISSRTPTLLDEQSCKFLKVTEKTRVRFFTPKCLCVFSLDLSPSMNVVDTSFKSLTTGCHLVTSLLRCLETALRSLVMGGSGFQPELLITVIAHGVPDLALFPLAVAEILSTETDADRIIKTVSSNILKVIQNLSEWLQTNHEQEQLAGSASCSRTRNACSSLVCQANDISGIVRGGLVAISMTCGQLGLSKSVFSKSILIVTDGVLAHPRKLPYDNALMHLNFVDVALHIIQVGGGFAPWSALGYASDPDLLRLLAASTPMGLFVQEHHLETKAGNALWTACSSKMSPLNKRGHTPYRSASYQSSMMLSSASWHSLSGGTYVDHLEESRIRRSEHAVKLEGIEDHVLLENNLSWMRPGRRISSADSLNHLSSTLSPDSDSSGSEINVAGSSPVPMTLKAYLKPERAKARPFLFKQYKLPRGVSAAQLVQTRVREGFVLENRRRESGRLTRTASSGSIKINSESSSEASFLISLCTHWGPVIDVIYEISHDESDQDELLIKIYLRMPSGDFFLRFKQQVGLASSSDTNLYQMCRQLDGFVETLFQVDDTLAKLIRKSAVSRDVSLWHRWLTVRSLFAAVKIEVPPSGRIRHGSLEPLLRSQSEAVVERLRQHSLSKSESDNFLLMSLQDEGCHVKMALSRTNQSLLKLDGSQPSLRKSDVGPLAIIEVVCSSGGVVRLNVGFFAACPLKERQVMDRLTAVLEPVCVVVSSPIMRAVQTGLIQPKKRKAVSTRVPTEAVGMGAGSMYTYEPDLEAVNRFMIHHEWEETCPPASLVGDVISSIHERLTRKGWMCLHESHSSAVYLLRTPRQQMQKSMREIQPIGKHMWAPEPQEPKSEAHVEGLDIRRAEIDWGERFANTEDTKNVQHRTNREACMCLAVHHVQPRGEKPSLKCLLWADRGVDILPLGSSDFREFCKTLCSLDSPEVHR